MHALARHPHGASSACLALVLAACGGDGPAAVTRNEPGVRVELGAGVTDTIEAQPLQALVVEVRGRDGRLASGVIVRFEARPPADSARRNEAAVHVCPIAAPTCGVFSDGFRFVIDTTDAQGRAKATVRLGRVAGRAVVRITVPELGVADSASFTVLPGAPTRVRAAVADTGLGIGATVTLRGRVADRFNNLRPEAPTLAAGAGTAFTVDAATSAVTGRSMGTQWLYTRLGTLVDSTSVRVVPGGRLVVWSAGARALRLVSLDGSGPTRTIVSNVSSDLGTFPRFDATRQRVTLHVGSNTVGVAPNTAVVIDTTGTPRRDLGPVAGFSSVLAERQLADGTVLIVGRRTMDAPGVGYSLSRVTADDFITSLRLLPGLAARYGGVDISHDGTRVAYVGDIATSELFVLDVATGRVTSLGLDIRSPRWSAQGDRLAYLGNAIVPFSSTDGVPFVINADGTGRRSLGPAILSPGLAWSPDGQFLVGRAVSGGMRLLRVSDGASVLVRLRSPTGEFEEYYQPDWR